MTLPTTKTITYPVWRDRRRHWFSIDYITGAFAMWAIRQSPYVVPYGLEQSVSDMAALLRENAVFTDDMSELSIDEIETVLCECFDKMPIVLAWNNPKSGVPKPFCEYAHTGSYDPDYDFIDLDALARNISHTLIMEQLVNEIDLEPYQG